MTYKLTNCSFDVNYKAQLFFEKCKKWNYFV